MSVHIIGKSPDPLAYGVPFLAGTRRAAAKTGLGGSFLLVEAHRPRVGAEYLYIYIDYSRAARKKYKGVFLSCAVQSTH